MSNILYSRGRLFINITITPNGTNELIGALIIGMLTMAGIFIIVL